MAGDPAFVWVDLETTGLDPYAPGAAVLEVAAVVTDSELNEIGEPFNEVVKPHLGWDFEDDVVREMHTENGLINDLNLGSPVTAVEFRLEGWLLQRKTKGAVGRVDLAVVGLPLAGSTISFDRAWLQRFMPNFEARLHYRNVDVSTLKVLMQHWNLSVFEKRPVDDKAHRALADVRQSIEELRYYGSALGLL